MQTPNQSLLPIRTVSQITGVNAVTLRAWERRYGLITPQRTEKGHRLYTQHDVEQIHRIVSLLDRGISVSHVKPLLDNFTTPDPTENEEASDLWANYRLDMLNAIEGFNEPVIDQVYNDAMSLYPIDVVNQRLIAPLLVELGERWEGRPAGIAEEHFFSVYLRNKIGSRIHHLNTRSHGPLLIVSCMTGEQHELGMLFFSLAAVNTGYRVVILGADLPLDQIPPVLQQQDAVGIVLSSSSEPGEDVLENTLPDLIKQTHLPVFVGGRTSVSHETAITAAGAQCVGENIIQSLRIINQTLNPSA